MISFDIFDTLITRKTVFSTGTFLIVQKRLEREKLDVDRCFIDNFFDLRISAENSARILAKGDAKDEVCIEDIYDELADKTGLAPATADAIKSMEMEAERDNIVPCMKNIEKLKRYHEKGERIVLISDMYLDSATLRRILCSIDSVFEKIPIYVSSEYGVTKSDGKLYQLVQKVEKTESSNWVHYGDNREADILIPRLMGIAAYLSRIPELEEWELKIADRCNVKYNLDLQVFLGMARYVRQTRKLDVNTKIGLSIGGMALYPYACWILRRCGELNINRLYFIARDGYIIKAVTDRIIKNQGLDVATSYFYGSRMAWKDDGRYSNKKNLIFQYIQQEIDFSDENFAFVDVQGTGETFNAFAALLGTFIEQPCRIFYYDLFKKRKLDNCKTYSFFTNNECAMCESVCRAPHDITIGYRRKNGKIVPVLDSDDREKWSRCGIRDFTRGTILFADYMSKYVNEIEQINVENQQLAIEAMAYIKNPSSKMVMDYFAEIPHGNAEKEAGYTFAPKLSYTDFLKIFLYRTDENIETFYHGSDLEYSLKRTNLMEKKFLNWCRKENFKGLGNCIHRWKQYKRQGEKVKRRKLPKIILYGAGDNGKKLFHQISLYDSGSIVAWVDIRKDIYVGKGYPVKSVKNIFLKEYDYLVLTMRNHEIRDSLRHMLQQAGIRGDKILTIDQYTKYVLEGKKQEE